MEVFKDKTVLITGGGSGIGKLVGELFLLRKARFILWDINQENINNTIKELSPLGDVKSYRVDIADYDAVQSIYKGMKTEGINIDILINNAGIVAGKYFHEVTRDEIQNIMNINALAPMYLTQLILPEMMERNSGYICNISSSAGLVSNPKMSVYVASKWSLLGWSDSLRLEMKQLRKDISVTTFTPYYIDTGMFDGVKSIIPLIKPEKAARKIIRSIEKRKAIASMPWSIHFVRFFQGVLPIRTFDWFVGNVLGVYKTMNNFTGRVNTEKNDKLQ